MSKIINTVTEMKNTFDGLNKRLDMAKEKISELRIYLYQPLKLKITDNKD
jgi:hypothetical protein